jgi:hypothetical protein
LAAAIRNMSETSLVTNGVEASRTVIERYSWRTVFERMFETYKELCENK